MTIRVNKIEGYNGGTPVIEGHTTTFNNVADMIAAPNLKVGDKCRTLGYYTPGGGGDNDYEIVAAATGTDDGGSFIDLSGSGLQARGLFPFEVISIGQFGIQGGSEESAKFQAVVDYLPAEGGFVSVPSGNYSATNGSLVTVPFNKMIVWVVSEEATMPTGLKGAIVDSGSKDHPHEGEVGLSTRPGAAHYNFIARHEVRDDQPNQQDSILYIEGEALPPGAQAGTTTEFAGVRTNMRMKDGVEGEAGVRCFHGTATGDGGNAKIRGLRLISIGVNGHDGAVTGALITATRTGLIPTSAGGDGVQEYQQGDAGPYVNETSAVIVQTGPGIRRGIQLMGLNNQQERPEYGIYQRTGQGAMLPEVAVLGLHAGGNGNVIEIDKDETSSEKIHVLAKDGSNFSRSFRSREGGLSVSNDSAILIPAGNLTATSGMFELWAAVTSGGWGKMYYRLSGTPLNQECYSGSAVNVMPDNTGALSGATGPDGTINISCDSAGIYIENRSGATRTIGYVVNSN